MSTKVAWSIPDISTDEEIAVSEIMVSGWLGMGSKTRQFESDVCSFIGCKNCIAVNSGTSALITALLANRIGIGDEVLVPTYPFMATVNSLLAIGAKPNMVDCDPRTFNVPTEIISHPM